jgi:hypothetical protein
LTEDEATATKDDNILKALGEIRIECYRGKTGSAALGTHPGAQGKVGPISEKTKKVSLDTKIFGEKGAYFISGYN